MESLSMPERPSPARTGVWVGIATITMSFAAYTSALVVRQGGAGDWQHIGLPSILYLNTLILLASSGTMEVGRRRLQSDWAVTTAEGAFQPERSAGLGWVRLTLGLGLLFIAGQVIAWRTLVGQGLVLTSGPSSAFFYLFTVIHALHLLGGVGGLGYLLGRLRGATEPPAGTLAAVTLYWHFMDVLWLYLLLILVSRL